MPEIYDLSVLTDNNVGWDEKAAFLNQLLEKIRKGDAQALRTLKAAKGTKDCWVESVLWSLVPEDKQWLQEGHCLVFDAVILAAMYRSKRTWMEPFVDEDTGEEVMIERTEISDISLFQRDEELVQRLFKGICDAWMDLPYLECNEIGCLLCETSLDTSSLNYARLMLEEKKFHEGLCQGYEDLICYQLGDLYSEGWEEYGIFIDKQKAKEYYDKVDFPYNPLDDEPDFDPRMFTLTIKGDASGLKTLIDKYTEMPDNELGIYAPTHYIMHDLVGSDPNDYQGNILFVEEKNSVMVLRAEINESANPLKYAIMKAYPHLEVSAEEETY